MEQHGRYYTQYGWVNERMKDILLYNLARLDCGKAVALLKNAIYHAPHPALVLAARHIIAEFDRSMIPDWVEALANGNLAQWDALLDEVKRLILAEEAEDDHNGDR